MARPTILGGFRQVDENGGLSLLKVLAPAGRLRRMNGANRTFLPAASLPEGIDAASASGVRRAVSALSFWGAIALPSVYLPLLVFGVDSTEGLTTFLLLFGLHLVALFGGRRYRRATGR